MHVLPESTSFCLPESLHGVYLFEISHRLVNKWLFIWYGLSLLLYSLFDLIVLILLEW